MKILHATESLCGGVEAAIADIIESSSDHEHVLWYAERPAARSGALDLERIESFPAVDGHRARVAQLAKLAHEQRADVIWAHSSWAGVYARCRRPALPVIYTPHCYSFCRSDLSRSRRLFLVAVEAALTRRTAVIAACGVDEGRLSRRYMRARSTVVVPNRGPTPQVRAPGVGDGSVVGIGRVCAQKGTAFFAEVATRARRDGHDGPFRWIGGGDHRLVEQMSSAGVEVTGWLPRSQAMHLLSSAGVYLHTAAWEGSPVTVLEAAALGVPVVARRIPSVAAEGISLLGNSPSECAALVDLVIRGDDDASFRASQATAFLNATHSRSRQYFAIAAVLGVVSKAAPADSSAAYGR